MIIREFKEKDQNAVEKIFSMYWTDSEFLHELSDELTLYLKQKNDNSRFFVSEENGEVSGVAGYKQIPDYLKKYAKTANPTELYIIAVKYKRKGIGRELKSKLIYVVKEMGFSEMLLFSPESHKESWNFHDLLDFERIREATPPEDGSGWVWSRVL